MLEINRVEQIDNNDDYTEIYLDVVFDEETSLRWELQHPQVLVGYSKNETKYIDYIELLNDGMSVHGFEFTDEQRKEILNYVKKIKQ